MTSRGRSLLLSCALLLIASCLVYWPGLSGGFILDDYNNIVSNQRIQIDTLDRESLTRAAKGYETGAYGRPLATLSFAFDHYVGGLDPFTYKLSSLFVHLFNALLVFLLVSRLLSFSGTNPPWHSWAPLGIALLWSIHPLQISTVLYVVQRMETLSTACVLLGLLAYLQGRRRQGDGLAGAHWLLLSALLAGLGMLAKESAILFPLYTLALELTLLNFRTRNERTSTVLKLAYAVTMLVALLVFFGFVVPRYAAPESFASRDFSLSERLLSQLRILPMYLGQMLLPMPNKLTFFYDNFPKSTGLLSPWTTLAGGLLLAAMAAFAWRVRRTMPLSALGIAWFFIAHALTSNVLNLELVFEHRNYFALLGMLLVAADLVHRAPIQSDPRLKIFAVTAVVLMFGGLATIRSATWGSPLLLATDLVAKNPGSPRAASDLATLLVDISGSDPNSRYFQMALDEFERASLLPGSSPLPEQGLILMTATTGLPSRQEWWDRLIHKVRNNPAGPQEFLALNGLMTQHYRGIKLDTDRLQEAYLVMLDRGQWPPHLYAQFGDYVLTTSGDQALATRLFVKSVSLKPEDQEFAMRVLGALIADGHSEQAAAVVERLRELGYTIEKSTPAPMKTGPELEETAPDRAPPR